MNQTCNITPVLRGTGRARRWETCGREAAYKVAAHPMNLACQMHATRNKIFARALRQGRLVELAA